MTRKVSEKVSEKEEIQEQKVNEIENEQNTEKILSRNENQLKIRWINFILDYLRKKRKCKLLVSGLKEGTLSQILPSFKE